MEAILNSIKQISPVSILVIAGVVIFFVFLYLFPIGLWFSAVASGVNITIGEVLFIRWRKIPVADVINGLIIAKRIGISVTSEQLQAHYLAGGDIKNVVHGLVAAKQSGLEISFEKAARANIKGVDIVKAVENKTLEYIK